MPRPVEKPLTAREVETKKHPRPETGRPHTVSAGGAPGLVQGYLRDQVEDAFQRYASAPTPENSATLPKSKDNNELGEKFSATGMREELGFATPNPLINNGNGSVAEDSPPVAGEEAKRPSWSVGGRPLNGYDGGDGRPQPRAGARRGPRLARGAPRALMDDWSDFLGA